jgi:hypothetical protein
MLSLFIVPEDGGSTFLRKVGGLYQTTRVTSQNVVPFIVTAVGISPLSPPCSPRRSMKGKKFRFILEHCHCPGITSVILISMIGWHIYEYYRLAIIIIIIMDTIILNQNLWIYANNSKNGAKITEFNLRPKCNFAGMYEKYSEQKS